MVNYRVRSGVSAGRLRGLAGRAARNFRCNKETHIWRFHYRAQLFQGRGALNKFIRHLTVIKDTLHAEARVIAIVLSSPLNGYAPQAGRFHNFAPPNAGKEVKNEKRWKGGGRRGRVRSRKRARGQMTTASSSTRRVTARDARKRVRSPGSKGCRHAGLTDKHNDLMTISYANDTKFYDRGA